MSGAVVALDSEKKCLHFTEGTLLDLDGDFFDRASDLWFPQTKKPGQIVGVALEDMDLPLGRNGRLQITDALIKLLQPYGIRRLRTAQGLQMG